MLRSPIMGGILAAVLTPLTVGVNSFLSAPKVDTQAQEQSQALAHNLSQLSSVLVSFQERQAGSEQQLAQQLGALAESVASTRTGTEYQINELAGALESVKQVAAQAADPTSFKQLIDDFGKDLEKRMDTRLQTLVAAETEALETSAGVGTLDVENAPNDPDLEAIQTLRDAAKKIVALEKEISSLKARSTAVSYPAVSNVSSGGSTGSYSGGSTGSKASYSYPVQYGIEYSYSVPINQGGYSTPVQQVSSQPVVSNACKWRRVGNRWVCIK